MQSCEVITPTTHTVSFQKVLLADEPITNFDRCKVLHLTSARFFPLEVPIGTPPTPGSFPKPLLQGSGLASPWTPSCPRASCMQDPFPKSSASWKGGCSIVNLLCFNLCFRLGLGKLLTVFLVVLDVAFSELQVLVVVEWQDWRIRFQMSSILSEDEPPTFS